MARVACGLRITSTERYILVFCFILQEVFSSASLVTFTLPAGSIFIAQSAKIGTVVMNMFKSEENSLTIQII